MNDHNPVSNVQYVPIDKVKANNYNPNSVATTEMKLLFLSILKDGYTQPVVTVYDENKDVYTIVDGFHRYAVMKRYKRIYDLNDGLLPVVVLKGKTESDRVASTIRHNRARGKHSTNGMANVVSVMIENGMTATEICNELGMQADEFTRLSVTTGIARRFKNGEFSKAKESIDQIKIRMDE